MMCKNGAPRPAEAFRRLAHLPRRVHHVPRQAPSIAGSSSTERSESGRRVSTLPPSVFARAALAPPPSAFARAAPVPPPAPRLTTPHLPTSTVVRRFQPRAHWRGLGRGCRALRLPLVPALVPVLHGPALSVALDVSAVWPAPKLPSYCLVGATLIFALPLLVSSLLPLTRVRGCRRPHAACGCSPRLRRHPSPYRRHGYRRCLHCLLVAGRSSACPLLSRVVSTAPMPCDMLPECCYSAQRGSRDAVCRCPVWGLRTSRMIVAPCSSVSHARAVPVSRLSLLWLSRSSVFCRAGGASRSVVRCVRGCVLVACARLD